MKNAHILIVDDEEDILELVEYTLTSAKFSCTRAASGTEAVRLAFSLLPDLMVLDLMLPGLDGYEVCSTLKHDSRTEHIPIIMLTAKESEADVVRGLEHGADDFIAKPFSPSVLAARVRAVLRRAPRMASDSNAPIRTPELTIHPGRHEVLANGQALDLTHTEFKLLYYLARRPGWVFTRAQLVDAVHGAGHPVTDRSVDVQVVGLRKKLGDLGEAIETVRGVGYRFKE